MQRVYDCSVDTDLLTGFRQAKVALQRHEVVVIPTDTVYGIAVDAFSPKAVELLLKTKGRERSVPPPVLIPKVETLSALATDLPLVASKLAAAFWPGALTMVLRAQPSLDWDLGETQGQSHFEYRIIKLPSHCSRMLGRWPYQVPIQPEMRPLLQRSKRLIILATKCLSI